jgi:CRP-like cAMP-binding protein
LSETEQARLRELLRYKIFPANANIISVEQPGEVAYIILSGTVKIQVEQPDGSEVILAILRPGEIVGEMSLVDQQGRSANAITMEESTLGWMNRACFWECLSTMPRLSLNLNQVLSRRLRLANEQIQSLATLDVYGRVARLLLAFAREYGEPGSGASGSRIIPFRLTQSDLASLIGATRVRVNQVLVDYKQRNWISVDPNYQITVHNFDCLARRGE